MHASMGSVRSMMSETSKSQESSGGHTLEQHCHPDSLWRNTVLHDRCNMNDMVNIKEAFEDTPQKRMSAVEFRTLLKDLLRVDYDDDDFNILFMKINTSRTGTIDWDELVSHLLLGYFAGDVENQRKALELPIMGLPTLLSSQHKHPISRICFCPDVTKDRTKEPMQGMYLTACRAGVINWWSLDLKVLRTAHSISPYLKIHTTWVTDMVCMPDVNIIVTSSTERDLRFYDCTAKTFTLRIIITSWEYMICTMYYYFPRDENEDCILVCGDTGGNVRMLLFSPYQRGPFKNRSSRSLISVRHIDLQKRPCVIPKLRLVELTNLHSEWVRQVSYYESLHCVVSCATCSDSLLMCNIRVYGSKTRRIFSVEKGIQCFAIEEDGHVLVTGGPDGVVRLWSPFVPAKASVVLVGHRAGITWLVLQNKASTIYSLSRDRTIKVWDVQAQVCLQTYIDIPSVIGERSPISAVYNTVTRQFIMAAIKIAVVVLDEQLNPLHTDGSTHTRSIAKILYNPLFKIITTLGMDSIIINWSPVTGKSSLIIRDAHVRIINAEWVPVEITAACFDPGFQLLLTGSRTGELKVWNFNTGLCLKTMSITHMCEVTACFWIDERILAMGWDRKVTQFEDTGTKMTGKCWEIRHNDDIVSAATRPPLTLATASYNSELVLWKLDTGQPYRLFSCTEPTQHIKMHYHKKRSAVKLVTPEKTAQKKGFAFHKPTVPSRDQVSARTAMQKAAARRVSTVAVPTHALGMRKQAVQAMIFLEKRKQHPLVVSLLTAMENGQVMCWSDHSASGYHGSFQAIHIAGDYVSSFATDVNNEFVFTGTTSGYLKVWLMTNFYSNETEHICMPRLRLMFPFLWRDRIEGRAKRSVRDQPMPLLLNSYRAHMRCVTSIVCIDDMKMICTGSSDYSVRLWRFSGEYLQTLGSFVPWTLEVTRLPPDIMKIASSTTFKVLHGGMVELRSRRDREADKLSQITKEELKDVFGAPPEEPLLGKYFVMPDQPDRQDKIVLDDSMPIVPMYTHLRMASTQPVRRMTTPELVRKTRLRVDRRVSRTRQLQLQLPPKHDK